MKFIKYAVGLVIALSVIPLVVITVNNLDQPKLTTVEFEVIDNDEGLGSVTFSDNTYTDLYNFSIFDNVGVVTNLITTKVNNETIEVSQLLGAESNGQFIFDLNPIEGIYDWVDLDDNNTAIAEEGISEAFEIGTIWEMTFEVPRPLPPLVKTLVGFAPLLFVGGVLLFMLNKRKLD